jgi:hypothetical protein
MAIQVATCDIMRHPALSGFVNDEPLDAAEFAPSFRGVAEEVLQNAEQVLLLPQRASNP